MAKIAAAPAKFAGDSIELSPLVGKMIGVYARSRDSKKTRFGERSMTHVLVVVEGAKAGDDPLEGIMFQTYFQDLKLDQWYVGHVAKQASGKNEAWVLNSDKLDKKKVAEFVTILQKIDTTVQIEVLL
jgi:hypothetical protein